MGATVFPAASGASLPAGATSLIASGFIKNGYASISGSFPAGKYLFTSDSAGCVNFTSAVDVPGYQNAIFSQGGSCVVEVGATSSTIEVLPTYSVNELTYPGTVSTGFQSSGIVSMSRRSKLTNDGMSLGSSSVFPYKGKLISVVNTSGQIWKSLDWETATNTTFTTGNTVNAGYYAMIGTDGTTYRGQSNTNSTNNTWYTTNPEAGSWSIQTVYPSSVGTPVNWIYGNGVWIGTITSNTTYAYSTNGGSTWNSGTFPFPANQYAPIAFGNGKFVVTTYNMAGTGRSVAYSTDGITWTTVQIASPDENNFSSRSIAGVAFGNGRFVTGWGSSVNTTDISAVSFVSVDGINWVPGSRAFYGGTVTSSTHSFFPVFDGTGFWFINPNYGYGWRTVDGINTIRLAGVATSPATYICGSRGQAVDASSTRWNHAKRNTTFAIYALDPSYTTY